MELYGDLYQTTREGIDDMPKILMRGTDYSELDSLEEDLTDFILATTNEKVAESYASNGVIINFILDSQVPFVDLSNGTNEAAKAGILISPFCHVEKFAKLTNDRYVIKLKKLELEELSDEEITGLKEKVVSGYSNQMRNFADYEDLASTISNWQNRFSKANNELDQRYIGNKLVEFTQEKERILNAITEYNNDCTELLMGLCQRKEVVVDNYLKAEIARREAEYRKEQLNSSALNIERLNAKIQRFSDKIQDTYRTLLDNEEYFTKVAKSMNTEIGTYVTDAKLFSRINDITTNLVQMRQEVSSNLALETDESEEMLAKEIKLENIGEELNYSINTFNTGNKNDDSVGDSIVNIYRKQATEQIKAQIYFSIEKLIYEARENEYLRRRNEIAKENISFFGKLLGKDTLQAAKLDNYNIKIQLIRNDRIKLDSNVDPRSFAMYTGKDILADIYDLQYNLLDGSLPIELQILKSECQKFFTKENGSRYTRADMEAVIAARNANSNLPALVNAKKARFYERAYVEAKQVAAETEELKNKYDNQEYGVKAGKIEPITIISEFNRRLGLISVMTERDSLESEYEELVEIGDTKKEAATV